ncbi:MAG: hypothetical protein RIC95_00435 [Vicingaceae bacterium]
MGEFQYNRKKNNLNTLGPLKCLLVLAMFLSTNLLFGQARELGSGKPPPPPTKKGFDPDRMRYGGSFGGSFGDITFVELSPTAGYLLTDNWMAGIGGRYIYYEDKLFNYRTNIYGGNIFNQYFFLENFLVHGEVEILNLDDRFRFDKRVNVTSVFVGGGYRSVLGDRAFANILLLYNLTEDINTPYTNPVIRVGFGIGL